MFEWWHSFESVLAFNLWMQMLVMLGSAVTTGSILMLWFKGKSMIRLLIEREQSASSKIKAVEKAAEQIRKELLATQQNQDIVDQRRRLAEMDADALRKVVEKTRKRYAEAEDVLKGHIEELKGIHITQTQGATRTQGGEATRTQGGEATRTAGIKSQKTVLDPQQREMLAKLLNSGPKGELDIISVLEDPKSHEIALEIKAIFDQQGWATSEIIQSAFSNPPEGFVLIIHSKQTAPSYAKFLQRTLTTLGLSVSAQINNKYREWSISMVVGHIE